jgi:predicted protein tyrosine phosphatase
MENPRYTPIQNEPFSVELPNRNASSRIWNVRAAATAAISLLMFLVIIFSPTKSNQQVEFIRVRFVYMLWLTRFAQHLKTVHRHVQTLHDGTSVHSEITRFTITVPRNAVPGQLVRVAMPGSTETHLFKLPSDAEPGQMVEVSLSDILASDQQTVDDGHISERMHMILEDIEGSDEHNSTPNVLHVLRLIIFVTFLITALYISVRAYQVLARLFACASLPVLSIRNHFNGDAVYKHIPF